MVPAERTADTAEHREGQTENETETGEPAHRTHRPARRPAGTGPPRDPGPRTAAVRTGRFGAMEANGGTIAVIGASGELGRRIARGLAQTHPLTLLVRDPARLPADLAAWPVHAVDLRHPRRIGDALTEAAGGGGLAGVVNAAGVVAFGAYGETPADVIDVLMAVNAAGVTHMLDASARLVAPGGFVANLTGVAGTMAIVGMGAYCASKAAASAAMAVGARELRRRQVRVLDIGLGHCETGLADRALHGTAPRLPRGIDPDVAATRIVQAILTGETELPAGALTAT